MKSYLVTLHLSFEVDATSKEVAIEKAQTEFKEWLADLSEIKVEEITVKEF